VSNYDIATRLHMASRAASEIIAESRAVRTEANRTVTWARLLRMELEGLRKTSQQRRLVAERLINRRRQG
jgi:hypothetical protein